MGMSVTFGALLVYFISQGVCLFEQLQEKFPSEKESIPGQSSFIIILCLIGCSIFFRMIFVSYEDLGKLAKIESMNAGTTEWQTVLTIEMITEVFSAISVFAAIYFIHRVEVAVSLSHAYMPVDKEA